MRIVRLLWLLCVCTTWVSAAEPLQRAGQGLSVGVAAGGVSGFFGLGGRYWGEHWGLQVVGLPILENVNDEWMATVFSSVQLLHRAESPVQRLHERSGYVQTSFYEYAGAGLMYNHERINSSKCMCDENEGFKFSGMGGGVGIETFWRNWRLATGVGMALYMYRDFDRDVAFMLFPTLDGSLTYGF